ncbi:alpha/beta-hydrolase [Lactarius sanguifluus]|nr:alpha/beta-hydrolase [Lactarius sanguifluus]
MTSEHHSKSPSQMMRSPYSSVNAAEWAYGAPLADIRRLVNRWKDGYDWRTHERELNALPMFTRTIEVDGFGELSVHYVHQKSATKGAIPLLFVHGWPGSILEVTKVLPLLIAVSADHPSFHVVAPSLPGLSPAIFSLLLRWPLVPQLFNKLMLALATASIYGPNHVRASHTNSPICEPPTFFGSPITLLKCLITSFTSREREAASISQEFFKNGMGYYAEQSTKPQTIGYSLADSPVGLLAWIYEKLVTWTDAYLWTDDESTLTPTIYRIPTYCTLNRFRSSYMDLDLLVLACGPATSVRIYYEPALSGEVIAFPKTTVGRSVLRQGSRPVPQSSIAEGRWTGCSLLHSKGRIVFESEHKVGGNFSAYEQPGALDARARFGTNRGSSTLDTVAFTLAAVATLPAILSIADTLPPG